MFVSYGATPTVRDIFRSNLNFDLATFLLVLCFTLGLKDGGIRRTLIAVKKGQAFLSRVD